MTYVGIDVSKRTLDVCARPDGQTLSVANDAAGHEVLARMLAAWNPTLIVLEATGGYEDLLARILVVAGLPVAVVNPRQVRNFAQATGQLAKTDRIDAHVIAHFAEALRPPVRPMPDDAAKCLTELVTRRRQVVEMIIAETNRCDLVRSQVVREQIVRHIDLLRSELKNLDTSIDCQVKATPAWRSSESLLVSVPGVGPITARTLIAELPELGTLDGKKIAALAGLAPMARDSGQSRGTRSIRGGRSTVRSALYIAALVASRHNPTLRAFWKRLKEAGKAPKAAIIAVARKLLTILNAIIRDQKPWAENDILC